MPQQSVPRHFGVGGLAHRWCETAPAAPRFTMPSCGRISAPPRCAANSKDAGNEGLIAARTGLVVDPYFSASKIAWLLDHVPGARARAERGELAFGTVDTFLLWRLTGRRACDRSRHPLITGTR